MTQRVISTREEGRRGCVCRPDTGRRTVWGAALVRPRDETKRGLDDPARIETRSCR